MAAVADVTPVCTTWFTSPVTLTTHAFLHIPMHLRPGVSVQPGGMFPRNAFMTSDASPFLAHAFPAHTSTVAVMSQAGPETCVVAWVSSSHGGHAVVGGGARTPAAVAGSDIGGRKSPSPSSSSDSSMKVIEQYGDGTQSGSSAGSHSSSHPSRVMAIDDASPASSFASHESYVFPGTAFFDLVFFALRGGSIVGWFPPAIADAASNMDANGEFGSGVDRHCGHPSPLSSPALAATRLLKRRWHTPPSDGAHARRPPRRSGATATRDATPETEARSTAAFIAPSPSLPDRSPRESPRPSPLRGPLWRAAISADSDKCRIVRRYDRAFCSPCLGRVDRQRDDTDVMDVYTSLMLCAHNTPPSLTHAGVSFSIRSVSSLMGFFASSFTRSIGVLPVPFCAVMSQPFSRSALTAKVFP